MAGGLSNVSASSSRRAIAASIFSSIVMKPLANFKSACQREYHRAASFSASSSLRFRSTPHRYPVSDPSFPTTR